MSVTRRRFLEWSTVWWLFSRVIPVRTFRPAPTPAADGALGAWPDSLIPADETPSATQLDVDKLLVPVLKKYLLSAFDVRPGSANFGHNHNPGR